MKGYGPRFQGIPVRLNWAGWEADTRTLQEHGWELSADQDIARNQITIAARHHHLGFRMITRMNRWMYEDIAGNPYHRSCPDLYVQHIANDIRVREITTMGISSNWAPIDATPQLQTERIRTLDDLAHFAPAVAKQQLIVPEQSVDDLMSRILDMQQDARIERIKQDIKEGEYRKQQKLHANIISMAA